MLCLLRIFASELACVLGYDNVLSPLVAIDGVHAEMPNSVKGHSSDGLADAVNLTTKTWNLHFRTQSL